MTQHALALLATPALSGQQIVRILEGACPVVGEAESALAEVGNAALLHLHLTDHLLAPTASRCAELVVSLARQRPISLTLHDLPQPCDQHLRYERRRRAYALMAAHACGVVVASEHERGLLTGALDAEGLRAGGPIEVIPLPIEAAPGSVPTLPKPGATPGADGPHTPRDLVVFGYLYPGKGHAAALDALQLGPGGQRADDEFADVGVLALGAPSPGHERLVQEYTDRARALGRRFTITGYLPDAEVLTRLRAAAVPVAAADHVSASGSIGSWLAAGRRPLAPAGPYVDELDA
ncbi:MAG: hypothetical protein Q4P32_12455, partial [Micrococcales bacterium]|nr:hypothetical protein [Micrococcales bacterium]